MLRAPRTSHPYWDYELRCLTAAVLLALLAAGAAAAEPGLTRVFIDCYACDLDYIRTEIPFVDQVRDPEQAQVHVLATTQPTGAGGTELTFAFIGREGWAGSSDTLRAVWAPADTDEERRAAVVRTLKLGLIRYVAGTPAAKDIAITYSGTGAADAAADPWRSWVFTESVNSAMSGQHARKSVSLNASLSASRVTAPAKINLNGWVNYGDEKFETDSGRIRSVTRDQGAYALWVKSLGEHWSAGARGTLNASTYNNMKLAVAAGPAVEYDFFPYSQSTRRQLRFLYGVNYNSYRYREETIYEKTYENLYDHSLTVSLEATEKWGSAYLSLQGSHYLHDIHKNNLQVTADLSLRLWEGLSLRLFATGSRVRDQLFLPRGGATEEEILLERSALATQYTYNSSVGLSYTFGSIHNNVVNPRFGA